MTVVLLQTATLVDVLDVDTSSGVECPEETEEGMLLVRELSPTVEATLLHELEVVEAGEIRAEVEVVDITEDEPFDAEKVGPALVDSEGDEVTEFNFDEVLGLDTTPLDEKMPKVSVLGFSELTLDFISRSSSSTLMLFQLPLRSVY